MDRYCKIVVFKEAGSPLSIENCKIPALKDGEMLVKNEYVTLCRSDISTYIGRRVEKTPTILGHEVVGRIVEFGPNAPQIDMNQRPLLVGDRITWAIYASDPNSKMSLKGIPQKSSDLFKYGHERLSETNTLHGGLAEYTIIRRYTPVIVLNEYVPLKNSAIINCSVATVAGSLRLAGNLVGKKVALWGIGMLGIIACAMCKEAGAEEIIAIDVNPDRLSLAKRFGATVTYMSHELDENRIKADCTIDYSGNRFSMQASVETLAIGGTAVWVGGVCPQEPVQLDSEKIIRNLYTIKGLHNYNAEDFRQAVNFVDRHYMDYPIEELICGGFKLDQAEQAFQYALAKNPFRVGINF